MRGTNIRVTGMVTVMEAKARGVEESIILIEDMGMAMKHLIKIIYSNEGKGYYFHCKPNIQTKKQKPIINNQCVKYHVDLNITE